MSLNYTFETLNDKEFEELSIDLLSKNTGQNFERFKPGKDQGIDGRFFYFDGTSTIIQCKHYLKSGVNALIKDLTKKELPKIQKLNPSQYIVVTSCPLSPMDKQKIKSVLSPYISSESDIYGQENLNDLLKKYPDVEKNHYKLWISSTNVLQNLLNNAILGRSKDHLKNTILKQSKFLVQTENFPKALQIIQEKNTIIITGSPGVGKTTLANQLSLYFVNEGYEFYYVDEDIKEAEDIFQEGKKQLFYFDDFLGSNILEALNINNRGSKIIRFIERVKNSDDKKFVLTSRAHILNQQIADNERYHHAKVNKNKYELEIAKLSALDKAKILYNHMWHSNLPIEFIDEIYEHERYKLIIDHQNYNPRIIEFITNYDRLYNIQSQEYWTYIQNILNNPEEIWKQVIENDIDEIAKYLLFAITLNKNTILENELKEFYDSLIKNYQNLHNQKNYKNTIEPLLDSLLKSTINFSGKKTYTLFNPSIADYFLNNYLSDFSYLQKIHMHLNTYDSMYYLRDLVKNNKVKTLHYQSLITDQITFFIEKNTQLSDLQIRYITFHSGYIDLTNSNILLYLNKVGDDLLKKLDSNTNHLQLINYLVKNQLINTTLHMIDINRFVEHYLNLPFDYQDGVELSQILNILPNNKDKNDKILSFKSMLIENIDSNTLTDWAKEDNLFSHITDPNDIETFILEEWLVNDLFSEIPFEFSDDELYSLINDIDFEKLVPDDYENDYYDDYRNTYSGSVLPYTDPISDLFHRD